MIPQFFQKLFLHNLHCESKFLYFSHCGLSVKIANFVFFSEIAKIGNWNIETFMYVRKHHHIFLFLKMFSSFVHTCTVSNFYLVFKSLTFSFQIQHLMVRCPRLAWIVCHTKYLRRLQCRHLSLWIFCTQAWSWKLKFYLFQITSLITKVVKCLLSVT